MERWWATRTWSDFVQSLRSIATSLRDARNPKETRIEIGQAARATLMIAEAELEGWSFTDADAIDKNGNVWVVLTFQRPRPKS